MNVRFLLSDLILWLEIVLSGVFLYSSIPIPFFSLNTPTAYLHRNSTTSNGEVFPIPFSVLEKEYSTYGWNLSDLNP